MPQRSLEEITHAFVVGLRSPDKTNFRPNDYWQEIFQTLQSTVPSSTSISQAIQALAPTPTPASKFLLGLAASRCDPPPNCAAVAHASCSVLLRAMRVIPSAATAIVIILCVGLLAAVLLRHVEIPAHRQSSVSEPSPAPSSPQQRSNLVGTKSSPVHESDDAILAPALHALNVCVSCMYRFEFFSLLASGPH